MPTDFERAYRLAVLIDADNASPRIVEGLFKELAAIGEASVRRIYGDFASPHLRGWTEVLAAHAIIPQQNFSNTIGKNASDIALVIDAMDLLHSGRFDAFCIVSSDSDFTRLAARIREHGVDVFGFGERKTPASFRQACKRFILTENLLPAGNTEVAGAARLQAFVETADKLPPSAALPHIHLALSQLDDVDGWFQLGAVGGRLAALMPDFDARTYGSTKLVSLIERSKAFEIRRQNLSVFIKPKTDLAPQIEPLPSKQDACPA